MQSTPLPPEYPEFVLYLKERLVRPPGDPSEGFTQDELPVPLFDSIDQVCQYLSLNTILQASFAIQRAGLAVGRSPLDALRKSFGPFKITIWTESGDEFVLWAIPLRFSDWRKCRDGLEATGSDPEMSDDFIHELVREWGHQIFAGSKANPLVGRRVQEWQKMVRSSDNRAERVMAKRNLLRLGKDLSVPDSKVGRPRKMDIVGEQSLAIEYEHLYAFLSSFSDKRIKRQWDRLSLKGRRTLAQTVVVDYRVLNRAINGNLSGERGPAKAAMAHILHVHHIGVATFKKILARQKDFRNGTAKPLIRSLAPPIGAGFILRVIEELTDRKYPDPKSLHTRGYARTK